MPAAAINLTDPINRNHYLNRGRVFWHLALPGLQRGKYLRNIAAPGNHPELKSGTSPTTSLNVGYPRPGGWGSFRCDAADEGAYITIDGRLQLPFPLSMAVWVRYLGTPSDYANVFGVNYDAIATNPYMCYGLYLPIQASAPGLAFGGNYGGTFKTIYPGTPIRPTAWTSWTRIVVSVNSAGAGFYVNGVSQGFTSDSLPSAPNYSTSILGIGESWALGRNPNLDLDDCSIWNRELSSEEIAADYKLGIQGYPGVLNRGRPMRDSARAAAATGNPWYYYSLLRG